ncbi:MAG: hypothetical protein LQ340_002923 [Diploschistes diacapsis]|nr:MAG: hypothetical protein LQ340_002923 [Diploschistes diacapsis]
MEKMSAEKITNFVKKKQWPPVEGQEYLLGFRGLLVIESFLWTFLITFAPNTVKDATISVDGPGWQIVFRKTLSVLFWNGTLIYSFFIILSARSLAITFFTNPTRSVIASAVVRRGIRLSIPVAVSLAIITTAFASLGTAYIDDFKTFTNNIAFATPYFLRNALVYFNSVYHLFWITGLFFAQSGNYAFPSQMLWIINLIYQQSFTVFILMLIVPYTRPSWRVKMAVPFVLTAWWVQSWAWFTVTGLVFADMVMHMDFKARAKRGIPLPFVAFRLPAWVPAVFVMLAGLTMQYLWTAWKPGMVLDELMYHTDLYANTELHIDVDPSEPQARDDNYLFILGFWVLFEMFDFLQTIFRNPVLIYLGKRSLSEFPVSDGPKNPLLTFPPPPPLTGWFLTQSWIIYVVGIKLFMRLTQGNGASTTAANVACFFVCLIMTIGVGEVFHRLVDYPADAFAHLFYDWLTAEAKEKTETAEK